MAQLFRQNGGRGLSSTMSTEPADATRLLKGLIEQMMSTLSNAGRALEARDHEEAARKPFLQQRVDALKALLTSLEREKVRFASLSFILMLPLSVLNCAAIARLHRLRSLTGSKA